jgi:hypothetical protein
MHLLVARQVPLVFERLELLAPQGELPVLEPVRLEQLLVQVQLVQVQLVQPVLER